VPYLFDVKQRVLPIQAHLDSRSHEHDLTRGGDIEHRIAQQPSADC
jgi:hypothetical protein